MSEPQVTWSLEHEADYQARLLAAYRLVYRAHCEMGAMHTMHIRECLTELRQCMSDRTRLRASQWERRQWKKEAKG